MPKPLATIIIPVAPYHTHVAQRAIISAGKQTLPVEIVSALTFPTPSILRNAPLNPEMGIDTPFVVFLDADDTLEPTFVEDCLRVYETGKYVYTSWYCDNVIDKPDLCSFDRYHSHLVTTLYPTELFKYIGGFDTELPAHEDVDFYLKSAMNGICGIFLDKPLVRYTEHGERSQTFNASTDKKAIMDNVYQRNGGSVTIMGCCGGQGAQVIPNPGQKQPGDVMGQTLWAGMHTEVGRATGRVYVGGNGIQLHMSPEDIKAAPELFRQVVDRSKLAPDALTVLKESGLI